jgi:hypothetical protein
MIALQANRAQQLQADLSIARSQQAGRAAATLGTRTGTGAAG